jgi:hypothetical protein
MDVKKLKHKINYDATNLEHTNYEFVTFFLATHYTFFFSFVLILILSFLIISENMDKI